MRPFHKVLSVSLTILAMILVTNIAFAQDDKESRAAAIKTAVEAHRYVFKAQSASPSRGRTLQLTSEYDLTVSGDTLKSFLPYFGRAFTAPIDPTRGGIEFTSTDFEYAQKNRRKGGWEISIKPRDVNQAREIFLVVFENGTSTLRVTSNNREPISFNGYVDTLEQRR